MTPYSPTPHQMTVGTFGPVPLVVATSQPVGSFATR